jgi:hypothetical protein
VFALITEDADVSVFALITKDADVNVFALITKDADIHCNCKCVFTHTLPYPYALSPSGRTNPHELLHRPLYRSYSGRP